MRRLWRLLRGSDQRWRKIRGLAALLKPYRLQVGAAFVAMMIAILAGLAPPYLAKLAIDDGILADDAATLNLVVVAFAASVLVYWGATTLQTYLVGWVGQRALAGLRMRIFEHLETLSMGFFTRSSTGVLISRLTNDVQALDQLVSEGLVTLFSGTLTLLGATAILLALDFKLALIVFSVFPVLAVASIAFRFVSTTAYRLVRDRLAHVTAYLQETLSGVRVVRAFSREPRHITQFAERNDAYREANMRTVYLNAAYYPSVELLSAVGTAVILLYGGYQALSGHIEVGVLVAFVGYLQSFFDPIQQLSQLYTTYQQGMAALDKIFDLLDEEPDLVDAPGAKPLPEIEGKVVLDDVWFAYEEGRWALRSVDLAIEQGETVALVGHTGAGKSTLIKLVSRFYDPLKGRVTIDGNDIRLATIESLRSQLGMVPQEGFLFSGTVSDNILFGRPEASFEEIEASARAVGADQVIKGLPDGYETEVGERGVGLSAGQRQLISFARALLADPRILLLDEATSSIDVEHEQIIEQSLKRLLSDRTAIVIAHRLSTVRGAQKIVVLERGSIVESGSHELLLQSKGAYYRLYSSWAEKSSANGI